MSRVHISHTAEHPNDPKTIESSEKLAKTRFAQRALWVGVMPVGMSLRGYSQEPELIGLYFHTIRVGRHPVGNGLHHFRAQIIEQRTDEPAFGYKPLETPGGIKAILAAVSAVEYLEEALPEAYEVVVTKPSAFNSDVKDIPMPGAEIATAQLQAENLV